VSLPALLAGALLFAALAWRLDFLCDDAFISFRYARNLVEGHGLRYNFAGPYAGAPPVEGYSNLLWVLWLAPFEALGLDLGLVARLSSALCGLVLVLWVTHHASRRFGLDALGSAATGLFLASLPCTALWATGGLATMAAALCLFGVYERLLGDPERPRGLQAGLFAGAAVLVRADGVAWVGMVLLAAGCLWLLEGRRRNLGRALLVTGGLAALLFALHVAWRWSTYGDWQPNTARVKAGFSAARLERGWNYVATFFLVLPSLVVVGLASLRPWSRELRAPVVCAATVVLFGTVYALYVGGDFMPFGRFLFATVPFFALLFAGLWARFGGTRAVAAVGLALVAANLAACFDLNPVPESLRRRFHFRLNGAWQGELAMRANMVRRTAEWSELGRALGAVVAPEESLPLRGIGAIGYYSRLQILDCYGLVSPEILPHAVPKEAASPGHDVEVPSTHFYARRPTYGGAFLAPLGAPPTYHLPEGWAQSPFARMMRVERHALPPDQGLPADKELRLLRFVRYP